MANWEELGRIMAGSLQDIGASISGMATGTVADTSHAARAGMAIRKSKQEALKRLYEKKEKEEEKAEKHAEVLRVEGEGKEQEKFKSIMEYGTEEDKQKLFRDEFGASLKKKDDPLADLKKELELKEKFKIEGEKRGVGRKIASEGRSTEKQIILPIKKELTKEEAGILTEERPTREFLSSIPIAGRMFDTPEEKRQKELEEVLKKRRSLGLGEGVFDDIQKSNESFPIEIINGVRYYRTPEGLKRVK